MSLPALPVTADTRSITERVNVLIRDYNGLLRVPAGVVLPFAGATAPDGFLLCDGSAVSRMGYPDLFAAIGTAHGAGDGATTFNLPDLRGRVAAGRDDMGGAAANRLTNAGSGITGTTLGASGGAQTHTLTAGEMPAHSHSVGVGGIPANGVNARATSGDGTNLGAFGTGNAGGGNAHRNVQPTLILNHVIAT